MRTRIADVTPVKSKRITILPLEIHYSKRSVSNGFSDRLFRQVLNRLLKEPDTYAVLPGDTLDSDRPSLRERKAAMYADPDRMAARCEADDEHRAYLERGIIKDLEPVKDKILAAVDGDHFVLYNNGRTSTQHILDTLKIPDAYLGRRMGWLRLRVRRYTSKTDFTIVDIFVRHGKCGYTTIGTDISGLQKQSTGFIADVYIGGHTHKKWVHCEPFLYPDKNGKIKHRPIAWARAGSLLRSFVDGQNTYSEEAEYSPLATGYPEIWLEFGYDNDNIALKDIRGLC